MELKSEHSRQGVSVTFTYEQSTTLRGDEKQSRIPSGDESENNICCVSLMWMNYKGEEVEYKKLYPGESYIVVSARTSLPTSTSIIIVLITRRIVQREHVPQPPLGSPTILTSSLLPLAQRRPQAIFRGTLVLDDIYLYGEIKRLSISKHTQTLLMISSVET